MSVKINVAMPEGIRVGDGWIIEWAAVSPSDGSAVSGVKVTNVNVLGDDVSVGGGTGEEVGPYMLVPGPGA